MPFNLTSGTQTFTFEFTVSGTDQNAKLDFLLGSNNIPGTREGDYAGPIFVPHSIWIDNVTLTEKTN